MDAFPHSRVAPDGEMDSHGCESTQARTPPSVRALHALRRRAAPSFFLRACATPVETASRRAFAPLREQR